MYLVKLVKKEIDLDVYIQKISLDLNWAKGMIGACPVCCNKYDALEYVKGDESLIQEVEGV